MRDIKETVKSYMSKARLKYNYFSCYHPKKSLQCKMFKFMGKGKIHLIKDNRTITVDKKDLNRDGKRLYNPADGG